MTNLEERYTPLPEYTHSHSVCGAILKVQNNTTKEVCALKVSQTRQHKNTAFFLSIEESNYYAQLLKNEIVFLQTLENLIGNLEDKHILPMLDHGTWQHDPFDKNKPINPLPAFVMPLGESSLQNIVIEYHTKTLENIFTIDIFYTWSKQILTALSALESIPKKEGMFSHQDIKPDNIIIWKNSLYLIDFGISRYNEEGRCTTLTGAGTLGWLAPEQGIPHRFIEEDVNGKQTHVPLYKAGNSVDVYTSGHILYWLVTKEPLACQKTIDRIFKKGEPDQDADRFFENIDGVSATELKRLKEGLQNLIDKKRDETIVHAKNEHIDSHPSAPKILPDIDYILDNTVKTIESMLKIKVNQRISATNALARLTILSRALQPCIDEFSLSGPEVVIAGHPFVLTITIKGTYPLTNGPCFTVYVGKTRVEKIEAKEHFYDIASIPETGIFTWHAYCSPLEVDADVLCSAEMRFDEKMTPNIDTVRAEKTITVECIHNEDNSKVGEDNNVKQDDTINELRDHLIAIDKIKKEIDFTAFSSASSYFAISAFMLLLYISYNIPDTFEKDFFMSILENLAQDNKYSELLFGIKMVSIFAIFGCLYDEIHISCIKNLFIKSITYDPNTNTLKCLEYTDEMSNVLQTKTPTWKYFYYKYFAFDDIVNVLKTKTPTWKYFFYKNFFTFPSCVFFYFIYIIILGFIFTAIGYISLKLIFILLSFFE